MKRKVVSAFVLVTVAVLGVSLSLVRGFAGANSGQALRNLEAHK